MITIKQIQEVSYPRLRWGLSLDAAYEDCPHVWSPITYKDDQPMSWICMLCGWVTETRS